MNRVAVLLALLALGGCAAVTGAAGMVGGVLRGPEVPGLADGLGFGPEDVVAAPEAYILVQVASRDIAALAREVNANGPLKTWVGESGYSLTLNDGMLVSTRGLGEDLIAANASGTRAALRNGGGTTERQHDYSDARDRIRTETYECAVSPAAPEEVDLGIRRVTLATFTETCRNAQIQFENLYFVDEDGTIIASRQFVSRTVAYLRNNSL